MREKNLLGRHSNLEDSYSGYNSFLYVHFVCFLVEPITEFGSVIEGTGLSATFGTDEVRKIHEENVNKLAGMSQEEIMAEQSKLLQMLGELCKDILASL